MIIRFFLLWSMLVVQQYAGAQNTTALAGSWEGVLEVGQSLRVVIHLKQDAAGAWQGSMDSPDQNAYDIACDSVVVRDRSIRIKINSAQVVYEGILETDSLIKGYFIQGARFPLSLKKISKKERPAETVTPRPFPEQEITVTANRAVLSGTFLEPANAKKKVAVLLISGSGPTDRNGNSPLFPAPNNSLLQLADSLAAHGIASLRYDKRGVGKSKFTDGATPANTLISDIADDAALLFNWLRQKGYKEVWIAGHSEGSLIGLIIAKKVKASGFISLAGAGRKASVLLKEQTRSQFSDEMYQEYGKALDSLEQGLTVKHIRPQLMNLLAPVIQPYLQSWLPLDPAVLVSQLKCPVLIVQGTKDIQVVEADALALKAGQKRAKLLLIPNMTHVLKEVKEDGRAANLKTYSDPGLPLAPGLAAGITGFINKR